MRMNLNSTRTMKVKTLLFAAILSAMASCSNNETSEENTAQQPVQFTIQESGFDAETNLTRSENKMGNTAELSDCEAEVIWENAPEKHAASTRAITTPTHYTVRVYQGSTLRGELKGMFNATSFTPDAGTPAAIELGRNQTYTVVCFNDDVTPNGTNLEVALNKAATARIGRQQVTMGTTDQQVNLTAKHAGVRIQTQVTAKKDIPEALTASFTSNANAPQSVSYDPTTGTYTTVSTATIPAQVNNSPASTEARFTASNYGQDYAYTSTSPTYQYVLPGTDAKDLTLSFTGGKLFWKTLTGSISGLNKATAQLEANGSYLAKIYMKPNYTYLMNDGTTGYFKDTTFGGGTKTPIAVVLSQSNRMAMALKDANNGAGVLWCINTYWNTPTNTHNETNLDDVLNASTTSGKDETWNASYSTAAVTGNKVKGQNADFPAFKAAADYDPGVAYTGSPALKWYLPSYSELKWVFPLGFGDKAAVTQSWHNYDWYVSLVEVAFTQVGGTTINTKWYWSSSELGNNSVCGMFPGSWYARGAAWVNGDKYNTYYVRPFVAY